ncbi:MAG: ribonuclease D [Alphaproteobacteria bacterium]
MTAPVIIYHEGDISGEINFGTSIAVDTETMGLKLNRDRLCLVQIGLENGECHLVKLNDNYDAPNLKKLLGNQDILKIFHFARFDVAIIKRYLGVRCTPVFCTKIASKLCRTNTDRHGLKNLCYDLLNVELIKEQQTSDWASPKLSQEQMVYAANDVFYLHRLKDKVEALLKREKRFELAQKAFDFLETRADLDLAGFDDMDIFSH